MSENTVPQIKNFFGVPGNPVSSKEMMDFWKSLSDEEKAYYKAADIG